MKRYLLACLLALPLSAVTQEKASAGFQFSCGGSCYFSFSCGGCGCNSGCGSNPCSDWSGGYPGYYGGNSGCYDGYALNGYGIGGPGIAPAATATPTAPVNHAQYP